MRLHLRRLLAFTKSFGQEEFDSVYCEREWRSTNPFHFAYADVAMIVVPRVADDVKYYDRFVRNMATIRLPRSVPIVSWEDLVEH
jgi:hypothetical protein